MSSQHAPQSPADRSAPGGERADVLTIDGPAGSGKSTTARRLADGLGWRYLDTGAMYRLMTCALFRALRATGRVPEGASDAELESVEKSLTPDEVESLLAPFDCNVRALPDRGLQLLLDGEPVPDAELRAPIVARAIKVVADHQTIRERLVRLQRHVATLGPLVTEGRDQGSVVFPDAAFKFFLTASIDERARRRLQDFVASGHTEMDLESVKRDVEARDAADRARPFGALVQPEDARVIDTTGIDPDDVIGQITDVVRRAMDANGRTLSGRWREDG